VIAGPFPIRLIAASTRLLPDSVKTRLNRYLTFPGSAR
jgi:hypothetical protein